MRLIVIKRDGSHTPFDALRITLAVTKAMQAAELPDSHYPQQVAEQVTAQLLTRSQVDINEIQQAVEESLMSGPHKRLAKIYIEYRHTRDLARERRSLLTQEIEGLVERSNLALLTENANKDSKVIPTQRDLLAGIVARHYAKRFMLPKEVVDAHEKGEIHYHDLDYAPFFPMFNCMLIDLKGMLTEGFTIGNAEVESPKSIATAAAVCAQIIAQVASHIYGGSSINRIDEVLAPFVTRSYNKHLAVAQQWQIQSAAEYAMERTTKECFDAFQALEYEVNTLHTANGQTPFVTFGFGLGTSWESRLIQRCILENRIKGLGKHRKTAIFPKLVFAICPEINKNPNDPNYDIKQLALECAAKRIYPDILNYDQVVQVTGSFKTPMGCRSFLNRYLEQDQEQHDGRNNLGVVSLNLPRIAIESLGDEALFWQLLDERLQLAKIALMTRIERLEQVKASVAPILYTEGACGVRLQPDDPIATLFKNGRASISLGYIGLHETVITLFDQQPHPFDSTLLQQKGIEIITRLRTAVDQWKAETGYAFSLYGTPSENLCSRFCQLDTKQFGLIQGVTDKGYYTNSFHLDVAKQVDPYAKIDFEQAFPAISSGGFICYGEYPSMQHNLKALEDIWDYSYDRVPYYGTNIPIDQCYSCGFSGEFNCTSKGFACPNCGNHDDKTISVTRRVCGYLGSPQSRPFNPGKQEEVKRRIKHL